MKLVSLKLVYLKGKEQHPSLLSAQLITLNVLHFFVLYVKNVLTLCEGILFISFLIYAYRFRKGGLGGPWKANPKEKLHGLILPAPNSK